VALILTALSLLFKERLQRLASRKVLEARAGASVMWPQ